MRSAMPPPAWRWMPIVARIAVGRVVATRRPSASMRSTGRSQIAAARSGGYASICARNASQPSVRSRRKASSCAPSRTTTCISASASAASVPGSGARCSSAAAAVRVRTGSITTRCAPALRASRTNFQKWWWLVSGFEPQRRISSALREALGIDGRVRPERAPQAGRAGGGADRHQVVAGPERVPQPRAGLTLETLQVAERPRALEGPDRLAAVLVADGGEPLRHLADRVVPADPLEAALALGADAAERVQQPVGRARVLEVAGDLVAQRAARERVVGRAAEAHRLPVADRDDPAAPVGAVQRAGAGDIALHPVDVTAARRRAPSAATRRWAKAVPKATSTPMPVSV